MKQSTSSQVKASVKKRPGKRLRPWLLRAWKKTGTPSGQTLCAIAGFHADADVIHGWRQALPAIELQMGAAAGRLARTLLDKAVRNGSRLVSLSVREGAALINMSRTATHEGLRELTADGFLQVVDPGSTVTSTRLRLMPATQWRTIGTGSPSPLGGVSVLPVPDASVCIQIAEDYAADIWTKDGLGEDCRRTYLVMARHEASHRTDLKVSDLARLRGLTVGTIKKHLVALRAAGLARRPLRGWCCPEAAEPTQVAQRLGVLGDGARRKAALTHEQRDHYVGVVEAGIAKRLAAQVETAVQEWPEQLHTNGPQDRTCAPPITKSWTDGGGRAYDCLTPIDREVEVRT